MNTWVNENVLLKLNEWIKIKAWMNECRKMNERTIEWMYINQWMIKWINY